MKTRSVIAVGLGAAALLLPSVASAATVTPPVEIDSGTVLWGLTSDSGFYSSNATCDGDAAFVMGDAETDNLSDAYDDAGAVVLNGTGVDFEGDADLTDLVLTAPAVTVGDFSVVTTWTAVTNKNWIRQTVAITNTTGVAADASLIIETNVGSDGGTTLLGQGDGWWASADDSTTANIGDPANTFLMHGVGTDHPGTVTTNCDGSAMNEANITEDSSVAFDTVSVPAGATVRFVLFYATWDTVEDAVAFGAKTDPATATAEGMFAGFTDAEIATILNWTPADLPTTGTSSLPLAMTALGLALTGAFIATLRRRTA